ncbi:MAG: glycoside hydrolase [Bacteroidota bacterium]
MRIYFIATLCILVFTNCNSKKIAVVIDQRGTSNLLLVINPGKEFQTIHSFGASDCWTTKFTGKWNDEKKKNEIADLLFSTDNLPDGSPKGIGLSLWRINIGAGSYEQGAASGIYDEYRREECFLDADGKYDWRKEAGAQWFSQAAKKRGVKYLLGFTNSAPVQFTQNGFSYGLSNNNFSCKEDKYDDFANFLVEVCKHFKDTNTPFDYISPVNEPQWKWGEHPSQEGSGSTNEQTAKLIKMLGPKLQAADLTTKIAASEAAQINFLYEKNESHLGDQINEFFNPASFNYLGNVPNTEKLISYHSYFTTCPDSALFISRQSADEERKRIDPAVELWQSEFGVLGDICGKLNGGPRKTNIDYGLYVAKVMHADLAIANVSSFQWWLAINPYDYSDGLVYINAPDGSINPAKSKEDGIVSSSKQLWCMGNFSRFIRPGMKRVEASVSGSANNRIMVSAYKDNSSKQLVTVIINESENNAAMQLQTNSSADKNMVDCYTTSATQNMAHSMVAGNNIAITPMSVTTLVMKYE